MGREIIFLVYGVHKGRAEDSFFSAFRTREEAEAKIAELKAQEMDGKNWAKRYHNRGFVIRESEVETDFVIPSQPKPRDRYFVVGTPKPNRPGEWNSARMEVFRRSPSPEKICEYERNYSPLLTFEPFRQGEREFALISREYTKTAVLDLATGEVIAEESETYYDGGQSQPGAGFCPVGFYVPDWWDINDDSIIPGSPRWDADDEWPTGEFGFVWGCHWGDDSSWKVQSLDLRRVTEGIILRDDRFGYVKLATDNSWSPCFQQSPLETEPSSPPAFISLERYEGETEITFAVEICFDFETGAAEGWTQTPLGDE